MKALVYTGEQASEVRNEPLPQEDGVSDCIVEVFYCGICGSDMHAWHGADERRRAPLILGHEAVGRVETGENRGRLVAINPLMTCARCQACMSGRAHLCSQREIIGMRKPGAFAEYVAISAENLHLLPEDVSMVDAATAEPLACSVHAMRLLTSDYTAPKEAPIVILGGGAIGLLCAMVARHNGYREISIAETNPRRREIIAAVIDVVVYDPLSTEIAPHSVPMILDAVGSGLTRQASVQLVAPGGRITHIGLQDQAEGLDTRYITLQEVQFFGSYCYGDAEFREALDLVLQGHITAEGWSDIRPLSEGAAAFMDIHNGLAMPKIILSVKG